MCGIHILYNFSAHESLSDTQRRCIQRRGPDYFRSINISSDANSGPSWYLTASASVLSMRPDAGFVGQPIFCDSELSNTFLAWNGEAWKYDGHVLEGHDSTFIYEQLSKATRPYQPDKWQGGFGSKLLVQSVLNTLSKISGPYAFVYYASAYRILIYGRDVLGRRSLLVRRQDTPQPALEITSVCGDCDALGFSEVEAGGIFVLGLDTDLIQHERASHDPRLSIRLPIFIPWQESHDLNSSVYRLPSPFPPFNMFGSSPGGSTDVQSSEVAELLEYLRKSMDLRLRFLGTDSRPNDAVRVAILFSGGLDCTVIAKLCHNLLPSDQGIDLLNVAFENPRNIQAAARAGPSRLHPASPFESCPDRISGRASHVTLEKLCPKRLWNFVAVDVPYAELLSHRSEITALLRPHDTEMDFSIGCALYFAARGEGTLSSLDRSTSDIYVSPARVLLSGLGADELFGGYSRHAKSFQRLGEPGLAKELRLDFQRIGRRNLGRDDRVISHWGKEVRYPFLDEEFVGWTLQRPAAQKCGFGCSNDIVRVSGKMLLRLAAWSLDLREVANFPKRAIQFGSRAAKMESRKQRGTHRLANDS